VTRQQLSTAYANKVYALDPTSDNWREEMYGLSKQYAAEKEELSRTSKREQQEASTDCVFCAEQQDNSILMLASVERIGK
jgi:hypothetical protein